MTWNERELPFQSLVRKRHRSKLEQRMWNNDRASWFQTVDVNIKFTKEDMQSNSLSFLHWLLTSKKTHTFQYLFFDSSSRKSKKSSGPDKEEKMEKQNSIVIFFVSGFSENLRKIFTLFCWSQECTDRHRHCHPQRHNVHPHGSKYKSPFHLCQTSHKKVVKNYFLSYAHDWFSWIYKWRKKS